MQRVPNLLGAALLAVSALFGGVAAADDGPERCSVYTDIPADTRDSGMAWNQLLSFAACVQDTQTYRITSAGELEDAVDGMLRALAPTLALYLDAIERGPGPIQLRAAYHVGMAYVSMITRARASIVAPPSFKDEAAATHFHAVHRQLESMLAPVLKATRLTFAVIVAAAEADPALASDEISKNMVKHARGMLGLLPAEPEEEDRVQWTGL